MYMQLITALALIGLTCDHYGVNEDTPLEGYKLSLWDLPGGVTITITITQKYYSYPGITCYFVNYSNKNGDFTACMGTPHIEQVLFDLGAVMAEARK